MMSGFTAALSGWRLYGVIAGLGLAIAAAGSAVWIIRADMRRAASADAADTINAKGASDADLAEAGRLAARACHAGGGVWNLAAGRCDRKPGVPAADQPARGRD